MDNVALHYTDFAEVTAAPPASPLPQLLRMPCTQVSLLLLVTLVILLMV